MRSRGGRSSQRWKDGLLQSGQEVKFIAWVTFQLRSMKVPDGPHQGVPQQVVAHPQGGIKQPAVLAINGLEALRQLDQHTVRAHVHVLSHRLERTQPGEQWHLVVGHGLANAVEQVLCGTIDPVGACTEANVLSGGAMDVEDVVLELNQ